jgi:cytochrome oxidase Cu insertion factor (SCO1/SenC/PrrC family)
MKLISMAAVLAALASVPLPAQEFRPGSAVTDFVLTDVSGHPVHYTALKGDVTVVMFFSTRCPISNAFNYRRNQLYLEFRDRVHFIAIDSNSNEPLAEVRDYARAVEFDFPVYRDENNAVADRLAAQVTTESFVIDSAGPIRYHGFIEDSPNPTRAKIRGLRLGIEAVLHSAEVATPETRSPGCSIRRIRPWQPAY